MYYVLYYAFYYELCVLYALYIIVSTLYYIYHIFYSKPMAQPTFYIKKKNIYIYFKTKPTVRPLKTPKKLQEDPRSLPSAAGHSRAGGASLSPLQICII